MSKLHVMLSIILYNASKAAGPQKTRDVIANKEKDSL